MLPKVVKFFVWGLLTACFVLVYAWARAGGFASTFSIELSLHCLRFTGMVMLLPMLMLIAASEIVRKRRLMKSAKRLRARHCPNCDYPLAPRRRRCSECGLLATGIRRPRRVPRAIALMVTLGILIGCVCADIMMQRVDQDFLNRSKAFFASPVNAAAVFRSNRPWPFKGLSVNMRMSGELWIND